MNKENRGKIQLIRLLEEAKEEITRCINAYYRNDLKIWADSLVKTLKILRNLDSNIPNYDGLNENDISIVRASLIHLEKAREYFVKKNKPISGNSEVKKAKKILENYLKENR